jgi:spermidine synthase
MPAPIQYRGGRAAKPARVDCAAVAWSDREPRPVVLDRRETPRGEIVLRRAGGVYELIANGTFLMDSRDGRSERAMVREAIAGRTDVRLLLGGLGLGISLDESLATQAVREVVVVEIEPAVVDWGRSHLAGLHRCGLDDPRVRLVVADLRHQLERREGSFDAICLDLDNGPGWLVHAGNAVLYMDHGLERLRALLAPRGRLTVWAAAPDPPFLARLRARFADVRTVPIPVRSGPEDVIYVAAR